MVVSYDPTEVHSDFICPQCGGLLYLDLDAGEADVCVNEQCAGFPSGLRLLDISKDRARKLYHELQHEREGLFWHIRMCDPGALKSYAYEMRKSLIRAALEPAEGMYLPDFFALGELLMILNEDRARGNRRDQPYFEEAVRLAKKMSETLNNIDDIQNRRHLLCQDATHQALLPMKYLSAIGGMYKALGMPSSQLPKYQSDLFAFTDIEQAVPVPPTEGPGFDFASYLDKLWPYTVAQRYAFGLHYRTSQHYNYTTWGSYLLALLSIVESLLPDNTATEELPISSLRPVFAHYAQEEGSFLDFLNQFAIGIKTVPIMVQIGRSVLVDRTTLLYFIMYLHGRCVLSDLGGADVPGLSVAEMKRKAAKPFEDKTRAGILSRDYTGHPEPVSERYEYDIIAISESKRRIVLADAKFRDISPSSISGLTLIDQELKQPGQGLLAEAQRQTERLNYFKENPDRFRKYLNPQKGWSEYDIRAFLITKHTPLIDRYKDVKIGRLDDFPTSDL